MDVKRLRRKGAMKEVWSGGETVPRIETKDKIKSFVRLVRVGGRWRDVPNRFCVFFGKNMSQTGSPANEILIILSKNVSFCFQLIAIVHLQIDINLSVIYLV